MKTPAEDVLFTTVPIEGELVGTSFVVNYRWSEKRPDLGFFPCHEQTHRRQVENGLGHADGRG